MDDEADEESWLILFFIKSCLTEARPAVPGKNMSKQAVLSKALKGTSIILSQKSNQYGISPASIEWNNLKVSSLSCLPWTNGCGKTQTSVLVEGGSPSMPHIYYFNFRDTVLLFIPSSAPRQTNSQTLLFMYPSAMSFHNFPILFSCIQFHLAPSHSPQKDATARYWVSRTTTVMFIFPLIWEIWKQRVFFTRSVSRGIIVYVMDTSIVFMDVDRKILPFTAIYIIEHFWIQLQKNGWVPTPIFHDLSSLQNMSVANAGAIGLTEQIWYCPLISS